MRRLPVAPFLALTLLVSGALPSAAQSPQSLRVLSREGTRSLPTLVQNNQEYVALDALAQTFGLTIREDRLAGGITVAVGNRSIIITPDQPLASVAGRLVSLSAPPLRQGTRWLLPLDFLSRALGPALETRIDVRRSSRLIVMGDLRVPRVVARVEAGGSTPMVAFDITPPTPSRVMLDAGRLGVVFEADALDLSVPTVSPSDLLQAIQPGDTPATVHLLTGPKFGMHRASTSQPDASSARLTIELLPAGTEAPPLAVVPPPAAADPLPLPIPPTTPGVRTIVIDAGHGGEDMGARGAGGTFEKDVTVAVARRLKAMIESRLGLRVFMTRDEDRLMTLDERSAYANSQKADVFISLHANAGPRPSMKGAEVYYLTLDRTETERRRIGDSAGVVFPSLGGGTRTIDLILWEAAQSRYLQQSATLAGLVEQALRARVEMSPRALQQAPLRVLVGANMPAVSVELGYLSNAEQEKALATGDHQDQLAQSLFDAIVQYRAQVERTAPPAPGARPQP